MSKVAIEFRKGIMGDAVTYDAAGHAFRTDLPPGCVEWLSDVKGKPNSCLVYTCACGCGAVGAISIMKGLKVEKAWNWDGDTQRPTLTPSIQKTFGCRWHGFLTKGEFVKC